MDTSQNRHCTGVFRLRRADDALLAAVDAAVARVVEQWIPAQIYAKYGITYRPPSGASLQ